MVLPQLAGFPNALTCYCGQQGSLLWASKKKKKKRNSCRLKLEGDFTASLKEKKKDNRANCESQ